MELVLALILAATAAPGTAALLVTPTGVELERLADNSVPPPGTSMPMASAFSARAKGRSSH